MYNDLFSIGGLTVHGYGLCIGIGIAAALLLIWRRAEERKFDVQSVNTLILLILAAGFAGAKLFFVFAHWSEFRADPLGALGSEGFVVYGGIVCGRLLYSLCGARAGFRAHRVLSRRVLLRKTDGELSRRHIPGGQHGSGGDPALAGAALFGGGRFSARRSTAASGKEAPRESASIIT